MLKKFVNNTLSFHCLAYCLSVIISALPVGATQAKQNDNYNTFTEWCENIEYISAKARDTVEVLLKEVETKDCLTAEVELLRITELWLVYKSIVDIRPLSGLTNLTYLSLSNNQITDISPLSGLTNLTVLDLDDNEITDISPLSGLTNLTVLRLADNEIADISWLSGLTNLTVLDLADNEITDISQLSGLTNLTILGLSKNQIANHTCPVQPESICQFYY
ncbi:MAG: leucine-rich repeat domain-containing protein [Symploca sp. SIO2C1]|nr:leucine-rich repeat domain-containing protein [Symploca sp. SIO2C1]